MRLGDLEQIFCSDCEDKERCKIVACDIKAMPTIDPVHAAGGCYCWECQYRHTSDCSMYYACSVCGGQWDWTTNDGFCSDGQRKETTHD